MNRVEPSSPLAALWSALACACAPTTATDSSKSVAPRRRPQRAALDLTGAGATFPYPIYRKWFSEYAAKTGVKINYQAIGSGGGIKQISEQTVDFGASTRR